MKTYTPAELSEVLAKHTLYLRGDPAGARANLSGADLSGAILYGAILERANLSGADLSGANLYGANLSGAILYGANLSGANLYGANLRDANLERANLSYAVLSYANLYGANLSYAVLYGANLRDANLDPSHIARVQKCPTGAFEAYKKVAGGTVLKLLIPADALRLGGLVGSKCRANKATVLGVEGSADPSVTSFRSRHDPEFVYVIGQTVEVADFCDDDRIECAAGIHFFITKIEAEEY